jgi:hypothetical protein
MDRCGPVDALFCLTAWLYQVILKSNRVGNELRCIRAYLESDQFVVF